MLILDCISKPLTWFWFPLFHLVELLNKMCHYFWKLIQLKLHNQIISLPFSKLEVNDQERGSQHKAENTNSDVRNSKEWILSAYPWGCTQNHSFLTVKWSDRKICAHWWQVKEITFDKYSIWSDIPDTRFFDEQQAQLSRTQGFR